MKLLSLLAHLKLQWQRVFDLELLFNTGPDADRPTLDDRDCVLIVQGIYI